MPRYVDLRSNGHSIKAVEEYQISDKYDSDVTGYTGSTNYFGFINSVGHWIILIEVPTDGTYRYVSGQTGYTDNWTAKTTLTGDYFYDAI